MQAVHHRHVQSTICANKFFNDHAIHYLIDANDLLQARSISESSNRQRAFKERECIHHTDRCFGLTCAFRDFVSPETLNLLLEKVSCKIPNDTLLFTYVYARSLICAREQVSDLSRIYMLFVFHLLNRRVYVTFNRTSVCNV